MPRGGFRLGAGRPRMAAQDIAHNTWDERVRRVREKMQELDELDIVKDGIYRYVKAMVGNSAALVVRRALESEQMAAEMMRKLQAPEARRLAKDDALMMLLHLKMSKHQYIEFSKMMNGCSGTQNSEHMVPSYNVVAAHKSTLRPRNVIVTETMARVSLQNLLQHTAERMVKANERKILDILKGQQQTKCVLIFCFGFDSASAQRKYKMRYLEGGHHLGDDKTLFAGVINPWALITADGKILWLNDFPQSSKFIRTFFLEYAEETHDYVRRFNESLQEEIAALEDIEVVAGLTTNLTISFRSHMTNIDGKVFNIVTETSSQQCPVCQAKRSDFNVEANIGTRKFRPKGAGNRHSVQPLHAIIKFLKLLTNLSFRLPAHEEGLQERTAEYRARVEEHAQVIQAKFKEEWGLTLEGPGQGGSGGSLDGNTSRRAFEDPDTLARILQINSDIVKRFKTILICVNSTQYRLDCKKFQEFAYETYRLYLEEYGWFVMSPSVHKVLIHSAECQLELGEIPLGAASEGGAELMHRLRKEAKLHSTRKTNRLDHNQDLMNRCLDVSDPLISAKAEKMLAKFRKRKELPAEALKLLDTGGPAAGSSSTRPVLQATRTLRRTSPPSADIQDPLDDALEDEDLGHEDGNETDYDFDLDEDMDTD